MWAQAVKVTWSEEFLLTPPRASMRWADHSQVCHRGAVEESSGVNSILQAISPHTTNILELLFIVRPPS
jgi:hypothetical protein